MFLKHNSTESLNKYPEMGSRHKFTRSFEDRKSLIRGSILHLFTIAVD